jgi:hypothetical protein
MAQINYDGRTIVVPDELFKVFLNASGWIIDSGDLFALMGDHYPRKVLEDVQNLQTELAYGIEFLDSSSDSA